MPFYAYRLTPLRPSCLCLPGEFEVSNWSVHEWISLANKFKNMRWIAYALKMAIVMKYTVEAGSCHLLWYRMRIMPMATTSRWSGNPQSQPFEICFLQLKNNLTTIFLSVFVKKSHTEWQSSKQAVYKFSMQPVKSTTHLRGCLSKNRPLNFAWKIILPETLASERLYRDYNWNRFALIHNNFLAALGGAEYFVPPRPFCTSWKLKIWQFLRRCKMFDLHHPPMNFIPIYR